MTDTLNLLLQELERRQDWYLYNTLKGEIAIISQQMSDLKLQLQSKDGQPPLVVNPEQMTIAEIPWLGGMLYKEFQLPNGRKYSLKYLGDRVDEGRICIKVWDPRLNNGVGMWSYIDDSPDRLCALGFLKAAARLGREPSLISS